jgi:hypothetical protein
MTYHDGIDALVNVNANDTLAAGGHAARHNSVNTALVEVKDYLVGALGSKLNIADAGLILITSQAFTTVSSVNVNDCFSSTYRNYWLTVNFTHSESATLTMRMRTTTDDTSSNYYFSGIGSLYTADTTSYFPRSDGASSFTVARTATGGKQFSLLVCAPNIAQSTLFSGDYADSQLGINYAIGGIHFVGTAYTGFSLTASVGTTTGHIRVYGYRN